MYTIDIIVCKEYGVSELMRGAVESEEYNYVTGGLEKANKRITNELGNKRWLLTFENTTVYDFRQH